MKLAVQITTKLAVCSVLVAAICAQLAKQEPARPASYSKQERAALTRLVKHITR